ncbi:MAG: FlgO family outer membrane protein [Poseidonibacter sp.]|uniref:FlgO family outer membrane protein n=1 Tax=Poseidonibacter sp. TaxID=2321188 RepID=UPI00359CC2D9
MIFLHFKKMKIFIFSFFLMLLFTSCSHKNPLNGTNDFHSLVSNLVDESSNKIKQKLQISDIVLVSDFVNLNDLTNKSELGFLLSSMLKDSLVSLDIIVREVEFAKQFQLGKKGFNVLIRDNNKILSNAVEEERYAVVGTYSITSKSLNVFIKLIDIRTGHILASSFERTAIDEEILQLEGEGRTQTLRPHVVL